ncbi:MAG: hypothetical protein EAZ27_03750 [Cytophagales bacterium]|nr:MAG: hypothetical protein EAZ27_03750 [Cytophagales bacterium]
MSKYFFKLLFIFIFLTKPIFGQSVSDTTKVLKINDLYQLVMAYHPVAKQADAVVKQAGFETQMARGLGFDPKIISELNSKTFGGKEYFRIWDNYLKVPTWFGAEFKVGYQEAYGKFVNPEKIIPSEGFSSIGITVPIGQGLILDNRRATLRQAQLFQKISDAEKTKILNKLFYEVAKNYWDWYFKYNRFKQLEVGIQLAENRYKFVSQRISLGEEPAIDSTEALILLQNRIVAYNQAKMESQNSLIELSNHLWTKEGEPAELDQQFIPEKFNYSEIKIDTSIKEILLNYASEFHPEILKLNYKINQLQIDRKLAIENLKPTINLNYSYISRGIMNEAKLNSDYLFSNNKFGFDISIPLVFRKELAKMNITKVKINRTDFEKSILKRSISNEILQNSNELNNTANLLTIQNKLVLNYITLRNGESQKFMNGESSLFLVNSRESSLIESQIKLAEMESKYKKSKANLWYSSGKMVEY